VYSSENLAVFSNSIIADYSLTNRDTIVLVDATAGNISINLAPANTWGQYKSPIVIFKRIDASVNTVTVFAIGGNNVDGGASFTLAAGASEIVVSDSFNDWYTL
jgi:hypothetical protein